MGTTVVGFRPADDQWNKMKAIWENCESMGIEVPREVDDFFDGTPPGDQPGMEVDLKEAVKDWRNEYSQGYEIDVTKLPKNVTVLRFYNSW